jgi:hypothetical protein
VAGKVRKYYAITERGRDALDQARGQIRELVDEVLEGHGPRGLSATPTAPGHKPTDGDARRGQPKCSGGGEDAYALPEDAASPPAMTRRRQTIRAASVPKA